MSILLILIPLGAYILIKDTIKINNKLMELKSEIIKTTGQRLRRQIRKRKMGVVTDVVDTIKVYPNTLTTVMIDW